MYFYLTPPIVINTMFVCPLLISIVCFYSKHLDKTHTTHFTAYTFFLNCSLRSKTPSLQDGAEVTWAVFKREFLDKYFPEDVRGKKEIEFLELKQGNMSVTEYAAKFVELAVTPSLFI